MKIKSFFAFLIISFLGTNIFAQQITKFGVVDTARVYNAYFRDSTVVKNYEKKKSEFQEEINKRSEEIKELQSKKVDYEKNNNEVMALRTQSEITKKTDFLLEYTSAKNIELESMQKSMQSSDSFNKKLSETLAKIAESEGYSMILSLQQANAILWYSNSVDITDQIIKSLGL